MTTKGKLESSERNSGVKLFSSENGMALLITVLTISILVALTVEFQRKTWQKFLAADTFRSQSELEAVAISGVNIARALLTVDAELNDRDSYQDLWATIEGETISDAFSPNTVELAVHDLAGRLPLNSLIKSTAPGSQKNDTSTEMRQILYNLLTSGNFFLEEGTDADTIIDALIDWLDPDDRESDLGAESSYYQSLKKSYSCRNGPILYIEELLFVRGITPELLYGTSETKGLIDFVTVYGESGTVNINTAPVELLKSMLPAASEDLIKRFDDYRKDKGNENKLARADWYTNISGWPADIRFQEKVTAVKSEFFQIYSTGVFDTSAKSVTVDIERDSEGNTHVLKRVVE